MHAARKPLNMIKYLILMLTFMCVVIEIIQIVVGAVLHRLFTTYTVFIDNDFVRATHFLIAVGIILVFLSIFGIAGIMFENVAMIFLMNCCGINSLNDWSLFHPERDLPQSCCNRMDEGFCMPHERGCHAPMSDFIGSRIQMIATGTTVIIVFQVICIITAIIMGARLSVYKRQMRAMNANGQLPPLPEAIMTEKPKY
ncbi:hypothetical protein ZHAS_00010765 [Anopheles sinensis]|uniref:Tetraspanin n=1 Tax=Anopheles sinensis TaxID=74873 RepID=A0A084VYP0_ANOSI|nr:hypothetical protein ZHAS_00010765 [Anopheles sinensis]